MFCVEKKKNGLFRDSWKIGMYVARDPINSGSLWRPFCITSRSPRFYVEHEKSELSWVRVSLRVKIWTFFSRYRPLFFAIIERFQTFLLLNSSKISKKGIFRQKTYTSPCKARTHDPIFRVQRRIEGICR